MTELALILGIQVAAFAYAWVAGQALASRAVSSVPLRRLGAALERATGHFSGKQLRVLGLLALAAAVLLFGLYASHSGGTQVGRLPAAVTAALSVGAGASLSWLATRMALRVGLRANIQVALSTRTGLDAALSLAMRSGAIISLFSEGLSGIGLIGLFGAVFALLGGTGLPLDASLIRASDVVSTLSGFPLGAALTALVCQSSASTYRAAVGIGSEVASDKRFALTPNDARNPALVGELAGGHLGETATRAALSFMTAATAQVATLSLGLAVFAKSPERLTTSLLLLPFVVRAFFVLATVFSSVLVRTEEMTNPSLAILRGYLSCLAIGLSGVVGSCLWLARGALAVFIGAGVLGVAAAGLVALPLWLRLLRPAAWLRDAADAARSGSTPGAVLSSAFFSLGSALQASLLPTLAVAAASVVSFRIGQASGLPYGGVLTTLVTWAAMMGCAPFAAAVSQVGTLAVGTRGVVALGQLDPEAQFRSVRLEETGVVAGSARAQLIASGAGACMLAVLAIPALSRAPALDAGTTFSPLPVWCGALGLIFVLSYAGSCVRAAVSAAREVSSEVERQLKVLGRDTNAAFSPSYKACVDLSTRLASRKLTPYALLAVGAPVLLALGLRALRAPVDDPTLAAFSSFVRATGLLGFALALALDAARTTLSLASPRSAPDPNSASSAAIFGHAAAPAAHTLMVGTGALALAIAPFLN
ncbi:MAG TPA: sodium/proton-translocating pyrophosphatase [Polyangiaceae bacterium]|nr:sodium/proton-translocating pyrophosphatase [Polyangiaceae bacterium]